MSEINSIAIIGAGEFQNPLILKAKEMGFRTVVFAWECGDIGEKTADVFYPVSITEKETILRICKKENVCAVVSIGSDLAVHTVNYVSRAMGFLCNSVFCEEHATNKFKMRKALESKGVRVPRFAKIKGAFEKEMFNDYSMPLIVKPVDRSGSRGITKIESLKEMDGAVGAACEQSFCGEAIVEEFITGNEYSCEAISFAGNHEILAFTKKYTTGAPHFIESAHVEPAGIDPKLIPNICNEIKKGLDALDIQYGAAHAEFRLDEKGNAHIIEIGARMGGDCIGSDLVMLSTGYDFVRMVIDVACGRPPELKKTREPKRAEIKFIMNMDDFTDFSILKQKNPERLWRYSVMEKPGGREITDSASRFGYYITVD